MANSEKALPFPPIPAEILAEIFSYLDKPTKLICRLTCIRWKDVLDTIFFEFHGVLSDSTYPDIKEATVTFRTIRVVDFVQPLTLEKQTLSRSGLALGPEHIIFQHKNSVYRRFPTQLSVSEENMEKILRYNRDVRRLTVEKNGLSGIRNLRIEGLYMNKLESIQIELTGQLNNGEDVALLQIGKIKKPAIRIIELRSDKEAMGFHESDNFHHYLNIFRFISMHDSRLESLSLRIHFRRLPWSDLVEPYIGSVQDMSSVEKVKADLAKLAVQKLKLMLPSEEGHSPYNLGIHLLDNQACLTFLEIYIQSDSSSFFDEIQKCVKRNSAILKSFAIRRYALAETTEEILPIFQALSTCLKLRAVHFYMYPIKFLPLKLPASVQRVVLVGVLGPTVLTQICDFFPDLELLNFGNLGSVSNPGKIAIIENFKRVLKLPRLKEVKVYSEGLDADLLQLRPEINVKRSSRNLNVFSFVL